MLFFRRAHPLLGTEAERGFAGVHLPGLRVYVLWMSEAQRFDSRWLPPDSRLVFPETFTRTVALQLGGQLLLRDRRELQTSRGTLLIHGKSDWDERWEGAFRLLVFEWTGPYEGAPALDAQRLGARDLARLSGFAARLQAGALVGAGAAQDVREQLVLLRAIGAPTPEALLEDGLDLAPPSGAQRLAIELGNVLSKLHAIPQAVDLGDALGIGPRHVRRRLQELGPWIPLLSGEAPWRRGLRRIRTSVAASLLSRRDARIEPVARSLGYGSARALLLALEQEGIPPPSELRKG